MSRIAPATFWEEPDARRATSRAVRVYAAESGGHWYLATDPAEQDAIFALDTAGRLTQTPEVLPSTGRVLLLGAESRVFPIGLPTSPIAATGYPILSGSDLVGFTAIANANRLEVTSGDLTGVGAAGDAAALVWNAGADGYDWTG